MAKTDHDMSEALLRQFVGYNIKRAFLPIWDDITRVLEPLGLRGMTFSALSLIVENPNISQSQLALALHIERSGVVVLVDELENADLISRNRVDGDRRAYALRATEAGEALWAKAEAATQAHEERFLDGISQSDRAFLVDVLQRIEARAFGKNG